MNLPLLYSFDDLVATVPFGERKMRTVLNDMGYGSGKGNKMAFSFAQIVEIQERVACLIDSCRAETCNVWCGEAAEGMLFCSFETITPAPPLL
tara:strand:+ start:419 stop:697 length:279 start_codon:yes stop_codon:yes gene_type:complete